MLVGLQKRMENVSYKLAVDDNEAILLSVEMDICICAYLYLKLYALMRYGIWRHVAYFMMFFIQCEC